MPIANPQLTPGEIVERCFGNAGIPWFGQTVREVSLNISVISYLIALGVARDIAVQHSSEISHEIQTIIDRVAAAYPVKR